MKQPMRRDTLQGLLRYPAPVYGRGREQGSRKKNQKFFQFVDTPKSSSRLSRRAALAPIGKTRPERDFNWQRLRKTKNL